MVIAVYDTYVFKSTGEQTHFNILVPGNEKRNKVYNYRNPFLESKGFVVIA